MVNTQAIFDHLDSLEQILDYKVSIYTTYQNSLDEMSVNLAPKNGNLSDDDRKILLAQLSDLAGIRLNLQVVEIDQIWEPESGMKPNRFIDLRETN